MSTQLMARVAAEHGVTTTACLAGTGLTADHLADPTLELEGKQELAVLRNVVRALGEAPFGLLAGERYHLTTHGVWGFALLSSPTVRHVVEFSANFFELSYSFNRFDFVVERGLARLSYDGEHNPEDLRSLLIVRDMAAALTFGRDLLGHKIPNHLVQLRARRPRDTSAYELAFGPRVEFNADRDCIMFAAEWLERQPTLADDFGRRVSEAYCRSQLEGRGARQGMAGRVRARILSRPGHFPDMESVAFDLGLTVRTLRNRLARESTSYRGLVDEIRRELAEQLLGSRATMEHIAESLGYTEVSSFTAAFKRWTGVSPRTYRHQLQPGHRVEPPRAR